jgi:hypothetical protein
MTVGSGPADAVSDSGAEKAEVATQVKTFHKLLAANFRKRVIRPRSRVRKMP